jgi:hypothetical protein
MSSNDITLENLPFSSLLEEEFMNLYDLENQNHQISYDIDMDRLSQLKFNPFQVNSNIALSGYNDELDTSFDINKVDCNYFLPVDLNNKLSNTNSFKHFLNSLDYKFQIIGLTETWLNNINCENFELIDYNYIGLNRINKKGGGVGMYISKQIQYKIRKDLNENMMTQ